MELKMSLAEVRDILLAKANALIPDAGFNHLELDTRYGVWKDVTISRVEPSAKEAE